MKVRRGYRSKDVQDRRGSRKGMAIGGGAVAGGGIIALLIALLAGGGGGSGIDLGGLFDQLQPAEAPTQQAEPIDPATDPQAELVDIVNFTLDDVQNTWSEVFASAGAAYNRAALVIFDQSTQSGCGGAREAIGPHYCPLDNTIYIDLDFVGELQNRFGASGDFALAYVIAHEVAHHVQNEIGVSDQVRSAQQSSGSQAEVNALSVRLELQADCFSGVWARTAAERDLLDPGDIDEALGAAAAVGDDNIQQATTGRVTPENFTHGTSEQRVAWFNEGFDTADPNSCDTFS